MVSPENDTVLIFKDNYLPRHIEILRLTPLCIDPRAGFQDCWSSIILLQYRFQSAGWSWPPQCAIFLLMVGVSGLDSQFPSLRLGRPMVAMVKISWEHTSEVIRNPSS